MQRYNDIPKKSRIEINSSRKYRWLSYLAAILLALITLACASAGTTSKRIVIRNQLPTLTPTALLTPGTITMAAEPDEAPQSFDQPAGAAVTPDIPTVYASVPPTDTSVQVDAAGSNEITDSTAGPLATPPLTLTQDTSTNLSAPSAPEPSPTTAIPPTPTATETIASAPTATPGVSSDISWYFPVSQPGKYIGVTVTKTPTPTILPTPTATITPTTTSVLTETPTPTVIPTLTATSTTIPTETLTTTVTSTLTATVAPTPTTNLTKTPSPTGSPAPTATEVSTPISIPTKTP